MFSDYACPWCYVGFTRLRNALKGTPVGWDLRPFPLSPDTPAEGRDLKTHLEAFGIDIEEGGARVRELTAPLGLAYPETLQGRQARTAHSRFVFKT